MISSRPESQHRSSSRSAYAATFVTLGSRRWLAITVHLEYDAARRLGCASATDSRVRISRTRRRLTSRPRLVISHGTTGRGLRDAGKHWKHTGPPFGIRVAALSLQSPRSGSSYHRRRLVDVVPVHESTAASPIKDLPYLVADHLPEGHRLLGARDQIVPVVYEAVQLLANKDARAATAALIRHVSPSQTSRSVYDTQRVSRVCRHRTRHLVLIAGWQPAFNDSNDSQNPAPY